MKRKKKNVREATAVERGTVDAVTRCSK